MPCPWYITAHAVRRYLEITRRPDTEDEFDRAEEELMEMAEGVVADVAAGTKKPKEIRPGLLKYRGPRPLRLGLMVSTAKRPEGPLPQLVDVTPSSERGGTGAGRPKGAKKSDLSGGKPHLVALVPVTIQLTQGVLEEIRRLATAEGIVDSAWVYRAIEERMRRQHGGKGGAG